MNFRQNHYVPVWYQKRFLRELKQKELHLLDLDPSIYTGGDGKSRRAPSVRRRSPENCFVETDLYTTSFGSAYSTEIEEKFFGGVDSQAPALMDDLENFSHPLSVDPAFLTKAIQILSIQKLRTPKGIRELGRLLKTSDKNNLLIEMQKLRNLYCAIWTECVWQIADASQSQVKFIVTDHPVTVYNRACYPGSSRCGKFTDPDIRHHGTHTLFPLSSEKVLILTNLAFVRDPFGDPLRVRPNPQFFRTAIFNALDIQTLRQLSEQEVLAINYVLKKRAYRFVAAAKREWLYPESRLLDRGWFNLGGGDIFMPDPRGVPFTGGIYLGYNDGKSQAFDAYGFRPWQKPYADKNREQKEWRTFLAAKAVFAKKHGSKRRGRAGHLPNMDPEHDEEGMHQSHLRGLEHLKKIKVWKKK